MSDITTRAGKGEPLTHPEVDANFTNLNDDKYQAGDNPSFGNITVTGTVDGRDVAADGSKLDAIDQGVSTTDSPEFAGLTVDTNTLFVDASTNRVGIGTSNPSGDFDVGGTIVTSSGAQISNLPHPHLYRSGGNLVIEGRTDGGAGGNTIFSNGTAERMRITPTGNVGIGTSSPGSKLFVSGTVTATGWSGGTQSEATWEAGTSTTESIVSPAKVKAAIEANAESPVKAWVNFDGTGTVSIRESFNVSSITDNGTGDYTVNFATALADGNYVVSGHSIDASSTQPAYQFATTFDAGDQLAGSVRIRTGYVVNTSTGFDDREDVQVSIIR